MGKKINKAENEENHWLLIRTAFDSSAAFYSLQPYMHWHQHLFINFFQYSFALIVHQLNAFKSKLKFTVKNRNAWELCAANTIKSIEKLLSHCLGWNCMLNIFAYTNQHSKHTILCGSFGISLFYILILINLINLRELRKQTVTHRRQVLFPFILYSITRHFCFAHFDQLKLQFAIILMRHFFPQFFSLSLSCLCFIVDSWDSIKHPKRWKYFAQFRFCKILSFFSMFPCTISSCRFVLFSVHCVRSSAWKCF